MKTLAIFSLILTGCAQTTFYRDGHKIAAFQGDMANMEYVDGDIRWHAATVDHSAATRASAERIQHAGTAAAASGLTLFLK